MILSNHVRRSLACAVAASLACRPVHGLVALNDGHDHVYVTGTVGYGWDSNLFANSNAQSDGSVTSSVTAEYTRRAGWIGVNASVAVDSTRYNVFREENFNNPRFSAELTKQTGRTTGSLTFSASRASRADAAVNARSSSWNYNSGLNFRYPIINTYTLSGQAGYSLIKYVGDSLFPDLATYTASTDLIRLLSSDRDLLLGYRYRHSQTSVNSSYDDNAANIGLSGRLLRGINGAFRTGYQIRTPHGFTTDGKPQSKFSAITLSGSSTYALSKRTNLTGSISKDFSTTATDTSVDTTTGSIDYHYAYSSHWSLNSTVSAGNSRFIGDSGRVIISTGPLTLLGPYRHDNFFSASASVAYSLNEHLKVNAGYTWFRNWSNSTDAVFTRSNYSLDISSRW